MTSQLAKFQEKNEALDEKERKFSMLLVGHDDSEAGIASYLKDSKLGCAAIKTPINVLKAADPLTKVIANGYTGTIPAVMLLDKDGKLVSRDQREVLLKLKSLTRGKSDRVKKREARAAAKKAAEEAAEKK